MTPEQRARQNIDNNLKTAGWAVQSLNDFNPSSNFGIAVTEYPTKSGNADYLLFVDRKPIGVIEAKAEGKTLSCAANSRAGLCRYKRISLRKNLVQSFQPVSVLILYIRCTPAY